MLIAFRRGVGVHRLVTPLWVAAYFLGMASRPMHSSRHVSVRTRRDGTAAWRVVLRRNQSDLYIWREVALRDIYGFPFDRYLDSVETVLDLGANFGITASYFQSRFPAAQIACVEPIVENLPTVRLNARASGADWRIFDCAVDSTPGEQDFYLSEWWSSASLVPAIGRYRQSMANRMESVWAMPGRVVTTRTVEDLLDELRWDEVSILKMDIEGAELKVLTEHNDWLRRVHALIVEIHDKYVDSAVIRAALGDVGFIEFPCAGPCSVFLNQASR